MDARSGTHWLRGSMIRGNKMPDLPEPKDGEDYYLDTWQRCIVTIEVPMHRLKESESATDVESRAVEMFRAKEIDGEAIITDTEKIKDVELDFHTDLPFNRGDWMQAKLLELGLNENGDPLRPGEKVRPECETTLADFPARLPPIPRIIACISKWRRWCGRAFKGALG